MNRWLVVSRWTLLTAVAVVGAVRPVPARASGGRLELTVVDKDTGEPVACRVHLRNAHGRAHKPRDRRLPFWGDHFVMPGRVVLNLPRGEYAFDLERGPEYRTRHGRFTINNFADDAHRVTLERCVDMVSEGWYSGDLDVRREPDAIELLMRADDLHIAPLAMRGLVQGVKGEGGRGEGQTLHCFERGWCWQDGAQVISRAGSELLLFGLSEPITLPKEDGEYPPTIRYLRGAMPGMRSEGGGGRELGSRELPDAGRHPTNPQPPAPSPQSPAPNPPWIDVARAASWDMPMLVAHGLVDSVEVADGRLLREGMGDGPVVGKPRDGGLYPTSLGYARWIQDIYFKLLDCGLRMPPTAGSGSGESPNPVGYNRVYVHVDEPFTYERWWENLRAGRVTVTNGPLLRPTVEGQLPGHVFQLAEGQAAQFEIALTLSTREPISYLEIIRNGRVAHSLPFKQYAESGRLPPIEFDKPGWFLVRVVTDRPKTYRFAMTGPWYVEMGGRRRVSRSAAQFFLDWVYERARQIELTGPERDEVIAYHRTARDFWQRLVEQAGAE